MELQPGEPEMSPESERALRDGRTAGKSGEPRNANPLRGFLAGWWSLGWEVGNEERWNAALAGKTDHGLPRATVRRRRALPGPATGGQFFRESSGQKKNRD